MSERRQWEEDLRRLLNEIYDIAKKLQVDPRHRETGQAVKAACSDLHSLVSKLVEEEL